MSTATALQPDIDDERLYRIGEVSRLSDLKPFVLRYWETEFPMLEPVKSPSGHRMYRQQDVDMVFKIKRLLYDEGFTIAGARRHLRETNGAISVEPSARAAASSSGPVAEGSNRSYSAASEHTHHADADASAGYASAGHAAHSAHGGQASAAPRAASENAADLLNRKMLLDLRDSLRGFLTLLERRGQ
ncbi:MAG TPA: MerR family transcriptional regulator [Candidatus Sulfotelmatobacter sp.]|nr:MerR family transcriptional regulator [Candidatus Sulfotelmatobacter sp.]